jgi:3-oxoacyl-(acyl-carrier-protein) synthase
LQNNTKMNVDIALSNNFAFGGINTSVVIKKV